MAKIVEREISAQLRSPVEKVWATVTDNRRTGWRSDLARVEVAENGNSFTEYTPQGFATEFTITEKDPCRRYAFQMRNANLRGDWTGEFSEQDGGCRVRFNERVTVERFPMTILAGAYLKKQQRRYLEDLKKALNE